MTTAAFTIRTDPDTLRRLDQLAKQLDRSRNYLANQALGEFLELQAWQIGKVKTGIAAAERGEFAADEGMERLFAKYPMQLRIRALRHESSLDAPGGARSRSDLRPYRTG